MYCFNIPMLKLKKVPPYNLRTRPSLSSCGCCLFDDIFLPPKPLVNKFYKSDDALKWEEPGKKIRTKDIFNKLDKFQKKLTQSKLTIENHQKTTPSCRY